MFEEPLQKKIDADRSNETSCPQPGKINHYTHGGAITPSTNRVSLIPYSQQTFTNNEPSPQINEFNAQSSQPKRD
jgi:hypothetical protein